ncbi:hypothetical protein Lbir_1372 [Legionella birminghamensis]|uniref:Na+-driven multidrug efflux pump n=1 Tax=Legionella birminghamensis TaxID=28083 RepID=A0A378IL17_9GAMM|nr:hypothetical protein [Legionella birminghamensis]KTC72306.1 hypothetical protein Lbir_1372 [Legionella birminghamensis]STX32814.1 Uncharacterised protein [Legionella birminghamensis]
MNNYISTIKKALPLFLSSIGLLCMGITDTIFCSWVDTNALIAQSLASFIYLTEFMTLVAFVFPIANLVALNPKDSCSILKSGLILICSLALLIIFTNSIFNSYISTYYLPKISQGLFQQYFQIVSMGLLTGIIFIYVRMTSTLLDSPVSFFREMSYAFVFNVFFDLLIYKCCTDKAVAVKLIALSTVFIFLFLANRINTKLSPKYNIGDYLRFGNITISTLRQIFTNSIPSALITLCEFSFFCLMGFFVTKYLYHLSGLYRIVIQIEEILILPIYSILTIVSIDISKSIESSSGLGGVKRNIKFLMLTLAFISLFLYALYPYIIKLYQIDANVSQNNIAIIVALFLSESLMLICITPLKGISKYNTIFYIVFLINMLMIAIVYSLSFESFNELLSLLILNNILIAMGSLWIWKVKYYKANQLLDLSGNLT